MKFTVDKVISAQKGDKEAFSQIYEEVGLDLYKIAVYTLGNKDDAEDVVLETVEAAYKGIKSLRDPNRFGAWIMKILSNKCKAKIRDYAYNNTISLEGIKEIEGYQEDLDLNIDMQRALSTLDFETKMIVLLTVFSGYKSAEIGNIFGLGGATVRSRYRRALKKLAKLLDSYR